MKKIETEIKKIVRRSPDKKFEPPSIFNLKYPSDQKRFKDVLSYNRRAEVVDYYNEQIDELAVIKNPSLLKTGLIKKDNKKDNFFDGLWIYYPWKGTLVHTLNKKDFYIVRTSRNHNLISSKEQDKLKEKRLGFAGLNVGNPGAICCVLEGVGSYYKFADFDMLSISNLNRFRAGLCELGLNKAILSAMQAYEVNPFSQIKVFDEGIKPDQADKFLLGPKIDVLVEEMDNLKLKIEIRQLAKKYRIPVVMVTGNGHNVVIDVERYDLQPRLKLLNGKLTKRVIDDIYSIKNKITLKKKMDLARDFMGKDILDDKLVKSFSKVGSSLAGIPQLSESSFLRGGSICYFVRKILLKDKLPSGRYFLDMDKLVK